LQSIIWLFGGKMRSRAYRRAQLAKRKKKALKIYPQDKNATWVNHLQGCSCHMCGNPRKHWKEKTLQEKKADEFERSFDKEIPEH